MNSIRYYIGLIIILFLQAGIAQANFEITEIMYDVEGTDTNREWVEVKNTGSEATDLSKWYFFSDNTKHALVPQGDSMVPPGGYAVIVQNYPKFIVDWPNISNFVFDSSWTGFSNEGETIAMKDPSQNIIGAITFSASTGANGDGNSLQNINGSWSGNIPTPGQENKSSGSGNNNTGTTTTTSSNKSATTILLEKRKECEVPKITTSIVAKNIVVVGLPFSISEVTYGKKKELLKVGKFVWNFGDGMARLDKTSEDFNYIYHYPGEYVITLHYYENQTNTTPDATSRLIVKVIPSEVSISSVGNYADPYIELENKSSMEVDLSKWYIVSGVKIFYIPEGMIMLPTKKLRLSPRVTMFTGEDVKTISLYNPGGEVMTTFPQVKSSSVYSSVYRTEQGAGSTGYRNTDNIIDTNINSSGVIDLDTLGANAGNSTRRVSQSTLAYFGFVLLILIASAIIIILHMKNHKEGKEDGEEGYTADDIKIME